MTRLYVKEANAVGLKVSSPADLVKYFKLLAKADQESFWVVALDGAHQVISCDMVSLGGINWASVDIRIAFKRLIVAGACSAILIHNHPSGKAVASEEDKVLTQKFVEAGNFLQITIIDHLIITGETYVSIKC